MSVKVWEWEYELRVDDWCASSLLPLLPLKICCLCGSRFQNRCSCLRSPSRHSQFQSKSLQDIHQSVIDTTEASDLPILDYSNICRRLAQMTSDVNSNPAPMTAQGSREYFTSTVLPSKRHRTTSSPTRNRPLKLRCSTWRRTGRSSCNSRTRTPHICARMLLTITPILEHNHSAPFTENAADLAETSLKMSRMCSFVFSTYSSLRKVITVTGEVSRVLGRRSRVQLGRNSSWELQSSRKTQNLTLRSN